MTSKAQGSIVVPVWSHNDSIEPLIRDDGRVPVAIERNELETTPYCEKASQTPTSAGTKTLALSAVPSEYIRVLHHIAVNANASTSYYVYVYYEYSGNTYPVYATLLQGSNVCEYYTGSLILPTGAILKADFSTNWLGIYIELSANGLDKHT